MLEWLLLGPAVVAAVRPGGPVGWPGGQGVDRPGGVAVGPPGSYVIPVLDLPWVWPFLLLLLSLLEVNYMTLLPSPSFLFFELLLLLLCLVFTDEFRGVPLLRRQVPNVGCWHFSHWAGGRLLGFSLLRVGGAHGARL